MLELPEPSRKRLRRSPLDLVVCQVRHDRDLSVADGKKAVRLGKALGDAYPVPEELHGQELRIQGGPGGVHARHEEVQGGWRFQSPDRKWTVTVTPEAYSLETTEYLDWDDFSGRLRVLTEAVGDLFDLDVEKRLGLRYIDKLSRSDVSEIGDWQHWVHPALLGPVLHPALGAAVDAHQGISRFLVDADATVMLRHAHVREDDQWMLVMDHDCFRESVVEFTTDGIMKGVEHLHTVALQVFQALISPEMFEYLDGEAE